MIILGITFDTIGTIIIAYMALRVHARVKTESRIDEYVMKEMRLERVLGVIGVLLIVAGYVLQVVGLAV